MALVKKTNSKNAASTSKKQIIKVNPYENAENVMSIMASICSAKPSTDIDLFWEIIDDAFNKVVRGKSLSEYIQENRYNLYNKDFSYDLKSFCRELAVNLETRENTKHTQIVVAGGFSSGKSSFLNRLTDCAALLPTGVEPVSVVKTYLYCSRNTSSISVKGVNHKNAVVNLNTNVLQAIQHAKKSNVYLASVLDKLFVEIPSKKLNGLVFIDTPGYNNSDKANQSNGKTDKETALEALSEGNILFWLVDCERGTTVSNDIEFIKQFDGKKVIIFNKADKKGYKECVKIVDEAAKTLYKEFHKEEIIDIIAFSTLENKIYCSKNNKTLSDIIDEAKKCGNGISEMESLMELIRMLFDDEIAACHNTIKEIEENYQKDLERKNENHEFYRNAKDDKDSIIDVLRETLIENYNEVMNAADKLCESSKYALDSFATFYDGVLNFENNDHWGSSNILTSAINKADKAYDRAINKHNAIDYQYYNEDYRKSILDKIIDEEDYIVATAKNMYDDACENCKNALQRKTQEEAMITDMQEYRRTFMAALEMGISQYKKNHKAVNIDKDNNIVPNVFDCIKKDDYKLFLHSFENGVDLSVCNPEGYNPLTFAVRYGNNIMVQFMLDHDADPSIKDKRGYNAFHTAVENQFRDICKILLDTDPELIDTKTTTGETIEELARKNPFTKWIEQEIDNAF